ncbi:MAG: thermosome subunit, partial [Thermoplasmata archaeon]
NVVLCQKGIDDMAQHFLAKAGIYAVRRVKKSDMEKLAKATGGTIVSNLDDLTDEDLGKAELVEERKIGGDKMTFVTGCRGAKAVTILVRGGSEHVIDEIERSVVDAISVVAVALEDSKMTAGGGATAIELAKELKKYAVEVGGREEMAVVAFAEALEVIPKTLAENAGLDPINTLIELRKAHSEGKKHHGLNVYTGEIEDMVKLHVIEPLRVGVQAIQSATETTNMILRIDDIIAAKQTEPPKGGGGGGMGGEMGGMEY